MLFAGGLVLQTAQEAKAETHAVAIASFRYQPADVRIRVGDTVEWRNVDPTVHTVTASRGEFSSGSMRQGQTFRARFNVPGVYPYFCEPHETMRGTVSVTGTAAPTTTLTTTAATSTTIATSAAPTTTSIRATQPLPTTTSASNHNGSAAGVPPTRVTVAPVIASGVTGTPEQASPVLPILAVFGVAAALVAGLRRVTDRFADASRYGAAAATIATGLLHLQVRFALDYPEPIGTLLVIEAAGAAVLTAWLVARPYTRVVQLTAIGAHVAALGALAITRTSVGLFGFHEIGWDPSPQLPVAVTLGLIAIALLGAARPAR